MSWNCEYKPSFIKDLRKVQPIRTRTKIEQLVFDDLPSLTNPFSFRSLQMKGYSGFYKIRVGSFRIGIHIDQRDQTVTFHRVKHRREIYRYFP